MQRKSFPVQRQRLVDTELRNEGIRSEAVLQAMRAVPREEFVPEELQEFAYRNAPLPIEGGQTISQPLIVAIMTEALELEPNDRVLEIGTGSGYAAAVLSKLVKEVFSVERIPELAKISTERLRRLGFSNVRVLLGDGTLGWPEQAPFDAIVVTAAGPIVPPALLEQLREGGRLVMPIGDARYSQELIRVIRQEKGHFQRENLGGVRFVPLVGEGGWKTEDEYE
jgi:protein-L-isoaspartate(D-aspartate) O-methyltransferase